MLALWHARGTHLSDEVTITAPISTDPAASASGPPRRRPVPPWAADLMLGIPVALGGLAPDPFSPVPATPTLWATFALSVAVAAALPLARRHPRSMLVATTLIAALAPLWTTATVGFVLAAAICLYRLAAVTSDRRVVLLAFLATASLLVASVAIAGPTERYLPWMLQPIAFLLGAAAFGEASRTRREYIHAITERAERAERTRELEAERRVTEERLRIARELHDAAGHQMAAINLNAGVAKNALPTDPERAIALLSGIQQSARAVLGEIGALVHLLRGTPGDADTLAPTATWSNASRTLEEFRRNGLQIDDSLPSEVPGLTGATDVVAYRVLQEGLANAMKHGDGRAVVTAEVEGSSLHILVENLIGAAPEPALSGQHGLIGIRERVASIDGTVSWRREARRGGTAFVLDARLPLAESNGLS